MQLFDILQSQDLKIHLQAIGERGRWYVWLKQVEIPNGDKVSLGVPGNTVFEAFESICQSLADHFGESISFEHITANPIDVEKLRAEFDQKGKK